MDKIHLKGNSAVDDDDIQAVIASQPTTKFLGVIEGLLYDYEIFDRYVLERDLQRIERYYHARGFYEARVRAARVTYKGRGARVEIRIEEGPVSITRRVDVHGLEALPKDVQRKALSAVKSSLPLGKPFEEGNFNSGAEELTRAVRDAGHAYAEVRRSADVDLPRHQVSVGYWVAPGPIAQFGEVTIEGLGPLPEKPVRRALDIAPGSPYSDAELEEAKRALLDLNVFSAVIIEPALSEEELKKKPLRVPLRVKVERSKLRGVHLGFGVQLDTQRTNVHLIAGWEDNNFLGGFRRFLVEARPGLVLYPTRLPSFRKPERLFPEIALRNEFRQPGFLEPRTNLLLRAQMTIAPLILGSEYKPEAPVIGYQDVRASAGLERSLGRLYGVLSHNVQLNYPFSYLGELDRDLRTIFVSYPELFLSLDLRNDRVAPRRGVYVSLDTQLAGAGGHARDFKIQPEVRGYLPLARKVTLATRGTVGFLFPRNYGYSVEYNARNGEPKEGYDDSRPGDRAAWVRDAQLMFLRGFFSGGSGSNRGYAAREIGPHGRVPFYNPGQSNFVDLDCSTDAATSRDPSCNLPLGGFTLWEASLELRYPISGPLSGTVFGDASDVAPRRMQFRFNRPHLSVGVGARYETPIGPVRLDIGYRVPGLQYRDSWGESNPTEILGLPLAITFGIGEAF